MRPGLLLGQASSLPLVALEGLRDELLHAGLIRVLLFQVVAEKVPSAHDRAPNSSRAAAGSTSGSCRRDTDSSCSAKRAERVHNHMTTSCTGT